MFLNFVKSLSKSRIATVPTASSRNLARFRSGGRTAAQDVVPPGVTLICGLGLVPLAWYAYQHEPWQLRAKEINNNVPGGNKIIERWEKHLLSLGLPHDSLSFLKCNSQSDVRERFLTYGACLLSFLGGVHWGAAMTNPAAWGQKQILLSLFAPLASWTALGLGRNEKGQLSTTTPHLVLSLSFLAQYFIDVACAEKKPVPAVAPWYLSVRTPLTTLTVVTIVGAAHFARDPSIADRVM